MTAKKIPLFLHIYGGSKSEISYIREFAITLRVRPPVGIDVCPFDVKPGLTARTGLERCWSGRKSGLNFDTAGLRAQNVENNRKQWRCFSGRPLKPALF